jgi:hypothetical protein
MPEPMIQPRPMPRDYSLEAADAHERGFEQMREAAKRACQLLHDHAPDMATCEAMRLAINRIEAIPAPARPSPTRFGILGEG